MPATHGGGEARVGTYNAVVVALALLCSPYAPVNQRYTCMAATNISRFYHNTALLLPDGNILVAGSEQGGHMRCTHTDTHTITITFTFAFTFTFTHTCIHAHR